MTPERRRVYRLKRKRRLARAKSKLITDPLDEAKKQADWIDRMRRIGVLPPARD